MQRNHPIHTLAQRSLWSSVKIRLLGLAVILAAPMASSAATVTWDGGGANAYWNTVLNWSGDAVPLATDDIVFGSGYTSGTPSLNGTSQTVNSLTFNGSAAVSLVNGSGTPTLTISSGNITKSTTGIVYLYSTLRLGASGVWQNTASGGAQAMRVYGSITDSTDTYGLTLSGGGVFILYGNNSYDGGTTLSSSTLHLYHNNALGTGALTIQGNSGVYFGASVITNSIVISNPTAATAFYSAGAQTNNNFQTTLGNISGNMNGQQFAIRGDARTWIFSGGITLSGMDSNGLQLLSENTGNYSYVFSSTPTLNGSTNGRIKLGATSGSAATGGRGNLLVDTAGSFGGTYLDVMSGGGMDTIAGIHNTGTVNFSPTGSVRLQDVAAGVVNLASLNSGAVTEFSALIDDLANTVGVNINDSYQQVNAAASLSLSSPVYETRTPVGIVKFSRAAGNTYDGGTIVKAGTLLVANTSGSATGTGDVTVRSGAKLGGTGIIAPTGTHGVIMQSGSILAPGEGIGHLRFNGGSTTGTLLTMESGAAFEFELGALGSADTVDFLNYTLGDFSLAGNQVNIVDAGGLQEGSYLLFRFYSDNGTTVMDSGLSSGLQIGSGLESYAGSYFSYAADGIYLVVVPEPSAALLLSGGLMILMAARRRLA